MYEKEQDKNTESMRWSFVCTWRAMCLEINAWMSDTIYCGENKKQGLATLEKPGTL